LKKIRKGDVVELIGSTKNETSRVLSTKKGVAKLETPLLGFHHWSLKILRKVSKN